MSFVSAISVTCMAFTLFPRCCTRRSIDLFHAASIARICWQALVEPTVYVLVFNGRGWTAQRMVLGLALGNPTLTCILNFTFSCLTSSIYAYAVSADAAGLFGSGHVLWYIFDEFFATTVVSAMVYTLDTSARSEARASVMVKVAAQWEATMSSILLGICDAVVRLDAEFHIRAGSLQLETLLLRSAGCGLEGIQFQNILSEEDKPRFVEHMERSGGLDAASLASSLHVNLRDAHGTCVTTQIFNAAFGGEFSAAGHLLGIRELSREEWRPSSLEPAHRKITPEEVPPESAMVWFNQDFTIVHCTPAFTSLGGPSTLGANFSDWIADKGRVGGAIQTFMNHVANGDTVPHSLGLGRTTLQCPAAKAAKLECTTDMELLFQVTQAEHTEGSEAETLIFVASLTHISFQKKKRRNRGSGKSQRGIEDSRSEESSDSGGDGPTMSAPSVPLETTVTRLDEPRRDSEQRRAKL